MELLSFDIPHDMFRIAQIHSANRGQLWRTYLRLCLLRSDPGIVRLLGHPFHYLERANLIHLFREIFIQRLYGLALDRSAPLIVDCGSNIGVSIRFFKDLYPDSRIIGFEPNPHLFPLLEANCTTLPGITLHQLALADVRKTINFFMNPTEPGALNAGMYATKRVTEKVAVQTDLLSTFLQDDEVDLVKLDVEGAEWMVLQELAAAGALRRIRYLVIEYHHHHHGHPDDTLGQFLGLLEQNGFGYNLNVYHGQQRKLRLYQDVLVYSYRKD